MPNVIKYSPGSTPSGTLKKGDMAIGNNTVDYGSTFWTGITPPSGGYTIYLNKVSNGPSIICPANDTELIYWTKAISGNAYATAAECLNWFAGQADKAVVNKDYEGIVTDSLVINLDAGFIPSYPRTGTSWYNLNGSGNGTLTNGPAYSSSLGGCIVLDGTDDIIYVPYTGTTNDYYTFNIMFNTVGMTSSTSDKKSIFGLQNNSNLTYRQVNLELWGNTIRSYRGNGLNGAEGVDFFQYYSGVTMTPNSLNLITLIVTPTSLIYYLNGVYGSTISTSVTAAFDRILIGSRISSANIWGGNLLHFFAYNKQLNASEIVQNYQSFLPQMLTENVVTNGLVLFVDAGNTRSYSGTGTTWYDISGNNNNAVLTNGPLYNSGDGGRFSVDGADDYISVSGMPTGNAWTYSMWYLVSGPTSFTVVGHRTFSATNTFRFQWDDISSTTGRGPFIDFATSQGGGQANYSNSQTPSTMFNQWHMVSVVSNGSNVTCYFDGSSAGGIVLSGSKQFSTNGIMRIGYDNLSGIGSADIFNRDGGSCYFSSAMVYNRALSAAEMLQNFNAQKVRFGL
jgi:hypothetical protein